MCTRGGHRPGVGDLLPSLPRSHNFYPIAVLDIGVRPFFAPDHVVVHSDGHTARGFDLESDGKQDFTD